MMRFSFLPRYIFIGSIRVSSDYYFYQFHNVPSFILIVSPSLPFSQKGMQFSSVNSIYYLVLFAMRIFSSICAAHVTEPGSW